MKQKWEYCRVVWLSKVVNDELRQGLAQREHSFRIDDLGPDSSNLSKGFIHRMDDTSPQETQSIKVTVAELGLDGWELVSHSVVDKKNMEVETFFFKRPIE